jgi:hypothetical protein
LGQPVLNLATAGDAAHLIRESENPALGKAGFSKNEAGIGYRASQMCLRTSEKVQTRIPEAQPATEGGSSVAGWPSNLGQKNYAVGLEISCPGGAYKLGPTRSRDSRCRLAGANRNFWALMFPLPRRPGLELLSAGEMVLPHAGQGTSEKFAVDEIKDESQHDRPPLPNGSNW